METDIKIGSIVTQNEKYRLANPNETFFKRKVVDIIMDDDLQVTIACLDEDVLIKTLKSGKEIRTKMFDITYLELVLKEKRKNKLNKLNDRI